MDMAHKTRSACCSWPNFTSWSRRSNARGRAAYEDGSVICKKIDLPDGTDDGDTDGAALSVGHVELLGLSLGPALKVGESLGPALTLGIALTVGELLGTALTVGGALTVGSTVVGNSPLGGILYSSGMASAVVSHTLATYCCICSDIVEGSSIPVMSILARLPWQQLPRPPNWVHWHVRVTYANL